MEKLYAYSTNFCSATKTKAKRFLSRLTFFLSWLIVFCFGGSASAQVSLSATATGTCPGGNIGAVTLSTSGGSSPYTFDYLNYDFSGAGFDSTLFETSKGIFSVNGVLQANAVPATNTLYDNSFNTKTAYTDNGYLRAEASFKFSADATVYYGLAGAIPKTAGAMPICFVFNQGFLSYRVAGTSYNFGAYDAESWYDFKIEKKGIVVKFYFKRSSEKTWANIGVVNYGGTLSAFKMSAQYYDDISTTRGFSSKNWKVSFNPPTTGLSAGTYNYKVIDATGAVSTTNVSVAETVPFNVAATVINATASGNDGSVNLSTGVNDIAHVITNSLDEKFDASYNDQKYTFLNGVFSASGDLRGDAVYDNSGWANSITTNDEYGNNVFLKYEGTFMFDVNAKVCFGFASAYKPIQNLGDHLISFYYNAGKLNYYLNGAPIEIGTYAPNTWYNFKIEKIANEITFYTQTSTDPWKLVGKGGYTGTDQIFKSGAQYYGVYNSNGGFNARGWKVSKAASITNLAGGNYTYQVISEGGCFSSLSFSIKVPISFTYIATDVVCKGFNNGTINIAITGGTAPYQYSIDGGVTFVAGNLFSNLSPAIYQVQVKDATGSTSSQAVTIAEPQSVAAAISADGPTTFCEGSSVTLTATPGANYLWSNGETTAFINATVSGSYTVKVTDDKGCSSTSSPVSIAKNPIPAVSISPSIDNFLCSGITLTANCLPNVKKYEWNRGDTTKWISLTTADADGLYSVSVTDNNGCKNLVPVSYNLQKGDMIEPYIILSTNQVSLGTGTTVARGSVGSTGIKGSINISGGVSIMSQGAIVKGLNVSVHSTANVLTVINKQAILVLPPMELMILSAGSYSDYTVSGSGVVLPGNYKNLTIKAGSSVTLHGNLFGSVTIEDGAQVTFTSTSIDMERMNVKNSNNAVTAPYTKVYFSQGTNIRVGKNVSVDQKCLINPNEVLVTFYLGDQSPDQEKFTVNGSDVKVAANLYLPVGKLHVNGGDGVATTMIGQFIAENISSTGTKVIWKNWGCNSLSTVTGAWNGIQRPASPTIAEMKMSVNVLPNPTSSEFLLVIKSQSKANISLNIMNADGRMVQQLNNVQAGAGIRLGRNFVPGTYFARAVQGTEFVTIRLIKSKN